MSTLPLTETTLLLPKASSKGSTLAGCIFNFTNSIVGAGCIGLGGAMAKSGGLISVVAILAFAILSKLSFDLLIDLVDNAGSSYEQLALQTYGQVGWVSVSTSRFLYAFGCLVAYVKILDDNLASALEGFTGRSWNAHIVTLAICSTVILPLSLMRDISLLERISFLKVVIVVAIFATIISLYPENHRSDEGSFQTHWINVRSGIVPSLGTFVFTFVAHHVVHLIYDSLNEEVRTVTNWKIVTTSTMSLSILLSLALAVSVYVTFWEEASSNIFLLYSPSFSLNVVKLLLSFMMMFTYPSPFLACRELVIISIASSIGGDGPKSWLIERNQLSGPLHLLVTVVLWGLSILLALIASSLGDVLNLVGCATGTMIAFILPALFSFRLKGYTHLACIILLVGGTVGVIGTLQCIRTMVS